MAHDRAGYVLRSSLVSQFVDGSSNVSIRYKHGRNAFSSERVVGCISAEEAERRADGKCVRISVADAGRDEWHKNKLAADLAYARR